MSESLRMPWLEAAGEIIRMPWLEGGRKIVKGGLFAQLLGKSVVCSLWFFVWSSIF